MSGWEIIAVIVVLGLVIWVLGLVIWVAELLGIDLSDIDWDND